MENPHYWSLTKGRDTGSADSPSSWPGDLVRIGRYRIVRPLGQGGFGRVYLARDDDLDRSVAIKVPNPERVADVRDAEDYLAEARALARLDHANIVPVYDVGRTDNGFCYVVSKFIDGMDLSERLLKNRPTVREAVELTAVVAGALHHAHQRGLVHRDIKPANILIDASHAPWVADFGLALKEEDYGKGARLAGTPAYMSPEQARGEGHRVDGRSDLFSLGVVLYELLSGRQPFRGDSRAEVMDQIVTVEPRPLRQIDDTIPRELERICHKALSKRAAERYSTGRDMAEDLRHFLESESAGAGPSPVVTAVRPQSSPTQETTPAAITPVRSESDLRPVKIVPKGLRSFDRHDADFFLELLPGPRDRDGLPESLRFWKTRIEATDTDTAFRVGLIYGPSGCGKSSLVKAGLLPRLQAHVLPVYVEATPEETESRLLKGLFRVCPEMPAHTSLVDALAALRRGRVVRPGQKVVVVLDQFEQWLFARRHEQNTELVTALRQCDGEHVQCIAMVRDDFWMAATRFMRDLEIRLVEGENSAAVDLFDLLHARRVLAAFGRAYSVLPEKSSDVTPLQRAFLEQSVAGLAQDGKVISVRLALFAEMVKGKSWAPTTLRDVGGTQGVGVTFLDETFSASTAPPEHRLHQRAAQSILKALLPESGTDIKGQMRSESELRSVSGYAGQPRDFDDLIRILDTELRLITPTDPETSAGEARPGPPAVERYYQLTHDYLVHSLRQWLTRKQRETRRGRAELRLSERAAIWDSMPEIRHLPSLSEWASIRARCHRKEWSEPQRRMMRRAGQIHGLRAVATVGIAALVVAVGLNVWKGQVNIRAKGRVDQLLLADIAKVPGILQALSNDRDAAVPALRQVIEDPSVQAKAKLRASLALLPFDPAQVNYLTTRITDVDPKELLILRDKLAPHRATLVPNLWAELEAGKTGDASLLAIAGALAIYDGQSPRWADCGDKVARTLVTVDTLAVGTWVDILEPVGQRLTRFLEAIFLDPARPESEHVVATIILGRYASADPDALARLLVAADSKAFVKLLEPALGQAEKVVPLLKEELERDPSSLRKKPPFDSHHGKPAPELVSQFISGHGLVDDRFAFCQTMPFDQCVTAAKGLRKSDYRLARFRPYADGALLRVAAVWQRDDRKWELETDLSATEVHSRFAKSATDLRSRPRKEGLERLSPVDLAGYVNRGPDGKPTDRYAVLWAEAAADDAVGEIVGEPADKLREAADQFRDQDLVPRTIQCFVGADGVSKYSGTWGKSAADGANGPDVDLFEDDFLKTRERRSDHVLADVAVAAATEPRSFIDRVHADLERARDLLKHKPGQGDARRARANANLRLDHPADALADLDALVSVDVDDMELLQYRAIARARLRRQDARDVLHSISNKYTPHHVALFLQAVVSAELGEDIDRALEPLEAALKKGVGDVELRYSAARAFALVSGVVGRNDSAKAQKLAERALNLLQELVATKDAEFGRLDADLALDPLRGDPTFKKIMSAGHPTRRYSAVWSADGTLEETINASMSPAEQLDRSRQLIADGYWPVAWSVARMSSERTALATSVWHRLSVSEADKDDLARGKARAFIALVRMDNANGLWHLLQHSADPRIRGFVVNWLHSLGAASGPVVKELDRIDALPRPPGASGQPAMDAILYQPQISERRALITALGTYEAKDLTDKERDSLTNKLLDVYRNDPDAGIHGAAEWTLRRWSAGDKLAVADSALKGTDRGERRWFINGQGQTFALVGPAEFQMGSLASDQDRNPQTEPPRPMAIRRRYWIATKEISIEQLRPFVQTNDRFIVHPGTLKKNSSIPDGPWISADWYAAAAYCNWLSAQEGLLENEWCYKPNDAGLYAEGMTIPEDVLNRKGYRLPTEAEWEYACRAGTVTSRYYGYSADLLGNYAWYLANSEHHAQPCGSLIPNDFGLFDMLGNVYEWCQDRDRAYRPRENGRFRDDVTISEVVLDGQLRIARNGAFEDSPETLRSASRSGDRPTYKSYLLGFRAAKTED